MSTRVQLLARVLSGGIAHTRYLAGRIVVETEARPHLLDRREKLFVESQYLQTISRTSFGVSLSVI